MRYPPQFPTDVRVIQPPQARFEEARIAFLEAATEFLRSLKRAADYWIERKTQQ